MVNSMWNSWWSIPGSDIEIDKDLIALSKVAEPCCRFDLIHHPALFSYAIEFHQRVSEILTLVAFKSTRVCYCTVMLDSLHLERRKGTQLRKLIRWLYYIKCKALSLLGTAQPPLFTNNFRNGQGDTCGINVSFIEDPLIENHILLFMEAVWDWSFHHL